MGCCFRRRPGGYGAESRRASGATRRVSGVSGERLLEVAGGPAPRARLGQAALELVAGRPAGLPGPGAGPERRRLVQLVDVLLVVVGEILQRLAAAGELLGQLV